VREDRMIVGSLRICGGERKVEEEEAPALLGLHSGIPTAFGEEHWLDSWCLSFKSEGIDWGRLVKSVIACWLGVSEADFWVGFLRDRALAISLSTREPKREGKRETVLI